MNYTEKCSKPRVVPHDAENISELPKVSESKVTRSNVVRTHA